MGGLGYGARGGAGTFVKTYERERKRRLMGGACMILLYEYIKEKEMLWRQCLYS